MQENKSVVSGVVMDAFFRESLTRSHSLHSIESPSNVNIQHEFVLMKDHLVL